MCVYANVCLSVTEFTYTEPAGTVVKQGCLSLSGAEVRRQRQEHRPGCLDLLSLSACFVTMQYGGGGTETSSAPSSCFWDSLASGSIWVFDAEQQCFHYGPEGNHRTKKRFGRPVLMHSFVMPPINIHASHPSRTSSTRHGCAQDDWISLFSGKSHNMKRPLL